MSSQSEMPLTSTHWGTYRVERTQGKITALHNFEHDQDASPIGNGIVDVLDGPTRIVAPMVRKSWLEAGPGANPSGRGVEPFVEVSWAVAEDLVAKELERVKQTFGNQAIFAGSYGWASAGRFHHAQSQLHRFLNCIGGYTRSVNTYSFAAAEVLVARVLGSYRRYLETATSWQSISENSDLVVAFGGIPLKNGQINAGGVGSHSQRADIHAAHDAGVEFVCISPLRSDLIDSVRAQWLAPRPCTDTAILLGIAHTLVVESLVDREFLARYTEGYPQFEAYVLGQSDGQAKTAAWAASISGLTTAEISGLARRMADARTMISVSWSLTRQDHGEQPFWAAITVAAMLGQIGLPGGGIGFGYSAVNSIGAQNAHLPGASLPQGNNPVEAFIPVARISDMLLTPGASFDYDGQSYRYPEIHLVYWAGGNPFHHHQDLNRLLDAWRKPDSVIVHEWCWNSLAKFADVVLPCTTPLERTDLALSPRDPFLVYMQQAAEAPGSSRNDYDILSAIAQRMDVEHAFTEGRDERAWIRWIYAETQTNCGRAGYDIPDLEALQKQGWFKLDAPSKPVVMLSDFRESPSKNPLKTPSGKIEIFSRTIASFKYDDCPGHASWLEPREWLGRAELPYPLHMVSNQPTTKLHSQLDHGSHSRAAKIGQREPVTLHPDDALARNIESGDIVRVFNARGACLAGAVVSEDIRPGVIQISTGAWFDPISPGQPKSLCKHGNPNVLTMDKGTSRLAQGPIAHSCLVEIERYEGDLPELTAFRPPTIWTEA